MKDEEAIGRVKRAACSYIKRSFPADPCSLIGKVVDYVTSEAYANELVEKAVFSVGFADLDKGVTMEDYEMCVQDAILYMVDDILYICRNRQLPEGMDSVVHPDFLKKQFWAYDAVNDFIEENKAEIDRIIDETDEQLSQEYPYLIGIGKSCEGFSKNTVRNIILHSPVMTIGAVKTEIRNAMMPDWLM